MYDKMEMLSKEGNDSAWSRLRNTLNLLIADVKIKLKRIKGTKLPPKYDVENISDEYTVEVKNVSSGLQLEDREPGELWNDIREIVKYTADKKLSKAKRTKVSIFLILLYHTVFILKSLFLQDFQQTMAH